MLISYLYVFVHLGTDFTGDTETFSATDGDLHLTLDADDTSELIMKLDDAINSLKCVCTNDQFPTYYSIYQ